jgi:hypothetical protein
LTAPLERPIEFLDFDKRIGMLAVDEEQGGDVLAMAAAPDRAGARGTHDVIAIESGFDTIGNGGGAATFTLNRGALNPQAGPSVQARIGFCFLDGRFTHLATNSRPAEPCDFNHMFLRRPTQFSIVDFQLLIENRKSAIENGNLTIS